MGISFAGHDVILESAPLAKFFDGELPRDWHGEHSWPLTSRAQTITAEFNWPWPPLLPEQFHVSELYWPTGAQRFAQCWLLATTDIKNAILQSISANGFGQLEMDTGAGSIEATMYLLPPRQLTGSGDLWLLPLVDQRYWWQFSSTEDALTITQGTTTWANVIDILKTQLLISTLTTSTIPSDYLYPDTETLTQYGGNCAALLDCVANSLGMRVVVKLDETVALESSDDGLTVLTANRRKDYTLTCGGAFDLTSRSLPAQVSVAFRQRNFNTQQIQGATIYNQAGPGVPATLLITGTTKRINSTCYADVTIAGFGGTPDNNTALTALAAQITLDYYNGLAEQYEYKFNSFIDWTPCYFDDYALWSAGALQRGDESPDDRVAGVRVRSMALNYGPDQQFQQGSFTLTPGYPPPPTQPNSINYASQFDIISSEPTLSVGAGTIVPFDVADSAVTNTPLIALTATPGQIKCTPAGKIEVAAKVIAKRTVADANFNVWTIWLQKSTDGGSTWTHCQDSMAVGLAYYASAGASLIFVQQLDCSANMQIRIMAMQENGSNGDVQIVTQYNQVIDGATLHYGSKLSVKYLSLTGA